MDFRIKIIKIIEQTHDVKSFILSKPSDFKFTSGQYCLVSFLDSPEEKRPFTFSNSPLEENIEITVKRMGEFTNKFHSLKVGDELIISDPKGTELNFNESVKDDIILIAGGSGITPFMSMVKYAKQKSLNNNIILFYANRTEDDIVAKDVLVPDDNLKVIHIFSQQEKANFECEFGRINKEIIKKHVSNFENKIWYICGPPPMTVAVREILNDLSISEIKIEPWELPGKK